MTQVISPDQVDAVLSKLSRESPMYNLSLSSLELFHSNFLHWLIGLYGYDITVLLFGKELAGNAKQQVVSIREKGNIDLTVDIGETRRLYIENKFKSLPSQKQLEKYYEKRQGECQHLSCSFILLTLDSKASHFDSRWIALPYSRILEGLETAIRDGVIRDGYHTDLIRDYIRYVSSVATLVEDLIPFWHTTDDFLEHESGGFYSAFQKHRLHDLYDKRRYACLAKKIRSGLAVHVEKDDVRVSSGFTRSTGLTDTWIKMPHHLGMSLVIQVQGSSLKIMLDFTHEGGKDPWTQQKVYYEYDPMDVLPLLEKRNWFSFEQVRHQGIVYPKGRSIAYNHYGPGMQYRRVELLPYTLDNLTRLVSGLALKGLEIARTVTH